MHQERRPAFCWIAATISFAVDYRIGGVTTKHHQQRDKGADKKFLKDNGSSRRSEEMKAIIKNKSQKKFAIPTLKAFENRKKKGDLNKRLAIFQT